MKQTLLLAVALLSVMLLPAQGVYQLWGMTPWGGENNLGVIYNTNANGNNFRLKYHFNPFNPGADPLRSTLIEYNNQFYGMTSSGGENYSSGIIFQWDPATNAIIKKFAFSHDNGITPEGSLIMHNGKFYGVTVGGGANSLGVIFEWDPQINIYTKKKDFNDLTGAYPATDLVFINGKFYGATSGGGAYNFGVLFQWDPGTNVYTPMLEFDGENGGHPTSAWTAIGNKIYGVTNEGGNGAIFEWDVSANQYTRKIEDIYGVASLTLDEGKLYAITQNAQLFEWDPSTNVFTIKVQLENVANTGNLTKVGDKFYGIVNDGNYYRNTSYLFEWDLATNVFTKLFDFDLGSGNNPLGALAVKNGKLYGMTSNGGDYGYEWGLQGNGVIFQWDPVTNTYTKKIDFIGANDAMHAIAGLTYYNGKLYGRAAGAGDDYSTGKMFEFDPQLNLYTNKTTFGGAYQSSPCGNLTLNNHKLYGTSTGGSSRGYGGGLLGWDPVSDNIVPSLFFGWPSRAGYFPHGSVTSKDGILYGMTTSGGQDNEGFETNEGVLFSWNPVSDNPENYSPLYSFSNPSGSSPYGSLTVKDGKLYGMTSAGGDNNKGVIFEYDLPPAYAYTKKIDFDSAHGAYPRGSLTLVSGKFYGVTSAGGAHNAGVIFEWDPATNIYQKKYDFDGINSSNPTGNLTYSDGKFYGVCFYGRPGYGGLIHEWDPVTNIFTDKLDFNGANGALPGPIPPNGSNDLTLAPAPVAKGLPGSCKTFASVTINSSNNRQWVSIIDEENNAVAEIKANGNNLGIVTASVFINNGPVREDGTGRLYLDRTITIQPQFPQRSPIDIRLYIKGSEFLALKNARNSFGQTAGINSINDLGIFKIGGGCQPVVAAVSNLINTTGAAWENDYVLSASINSFTSFCFASKSPCAAPLITQVSASHTILSPADHQMKDITVNYSATGNCWPVSSSLSVTSNEAVSGTGAGDLSPDWVVIDDHHVQLRAERSHRGTGRIYTITITSKNAFGTTCKKTIKVTVPYQQPAICARSADNELKNTDLPDCRVTPNPSSQYFTLQVQTASPEKMEVTVFDISGRQIKKINMQKNQALRFGEEFKPGIYLVKITQGEQQKIIKVVKQ